GGGRAAPGLCTVDWRPSAAGSRVETATSAAEPGSWLIFADASGAGHRLAALLEEAGERCQLVVRRDSARPVSGREIRIDADEGDAYRGLLGRLADGQHGPGRGVVYLWGLDAGGDADAGADADSPCRSALQLVQALAETEWRHPPRL